MATPVEKVLQLDGKQLALPTGTWIVAADGANDWNDLSIGAYGYLRTIILFQVANNRVDTILEVNTNVLPTTDGWGTASDCARTDLVLAVIRYRAGWDGSCYFVTHTLLSKEFHHGLAQRAEFRGGEGVAPVAGVGDRWLPRRRPQRRAGRARTISPRRRVAFLAKRLRNGRTRGGCPPSWTPIHRATPLPVR